MRALYWTDEALKNLRAEIVYIAQRDKEAARQVRNRINDAALLLQEHPVGRQGRVSGTYEKSVTRTPYIIAYALTDDAVTILRVIHSRRNWTAEEWPE